MTPKQPRAKEDWKSFKDVPENIRKIIEREAHQGMLRVGNPPLDLANDIKYLLAARDKEIIKILESCKKHCPSCEGDPEEWAGDECNKEWNGALDTAIDALVGKEKTK